MYFTSRSRLPLVSAREMGTAYYNEIDPGAAAWLRELIKAGAIAPGIVDERDIRDIAPRDLDGFTQCHFFAGIGVWSYALRLAGWPDEEPVWTGSCPCQPFSAAGRGLGFADERHLWPAWFHLIAQRRPAVIFGEQVAGPGGIAWFELVRSDLEAAGYPIGGLDTCAAGFGAPHIRQRLWFVAESGGERFKGQRLRLQPGASRLTRVEAGRSGKTRGFWSAADWIFCTDGKYRPVEPGSFPLAHGAAARLGRLRGYGNAIVAEAAKEIIVAYRQSLQPLARAHNAG